MNRFVLAAVAVLLFAGSTQAAVVFDNWNATGNGHFTNQPSFAGQSTVSTASTWGRVTTTAAEGAGSMRLGLVTSTNAIQRVRFLSGGGTPANNQTAVIPGTVGSGVMSISDAVDGFIGYYYKTTQAGIGLQIVIEDSTNVTAGLSGSTIKTVVADGEWHLVEWNLDAANNWAAGLSGLVTTSAAINTSATPKTYTIDSLYITGLPTGAGNNVELFFDFIAKSDSGSIAPMLPEPASATLLLLAGVAGLRRRRRC